MIHSMHNQDYTWAKGPSMHQHGPPRAMRGHQPTKDEPVSGHSVLSAYRKGQAEQREGDLAKWL